MLQEWVGQLMDGGYPAALPDGRDSKPLSARSIRNIMNVVLKGIFDYAVWHEHRRHRRGQHRNHHRRH